jgi:hypothetical protein
MDRNGLSVNAGQVSKTCGKFEVKGDELFLHQAESDCEAFSKALTSKPYKRVK